MILPEGLDAGFCSLLPATWISRGPDVSPMQMTMTAEWLCQQELVMGSEQTQQGRGTGRCCSQCCLMLGVLGTVQEGKAVPM